MLNRTKQEMLFPNVISSKVILALITMYDLLNPEDINREGYIILRDGENVPTKYATYDILKFPFEGVYIYCERKIYDLAISYKNNKKRGILGNKNNKEIKDPIEIMFIDDYLVKNSLSNEELQVFKKFFDKTLKETRFNLTTRKSASMIEIIMLFLEHTIYFVDMKKDIGVEFYDYFYKFSECFVEIQSEEVSKETLTLNLYKRHEPATEESYSLNIIFKKEKGKISLEDVCLFDFIKSQTYDIKDIDENLEKFISIKKLSKLIDKLFKLESGYWARIIFKDLKENDLIKIGDEIFKAKRNKKIGRKACSLCDLNGNEFIYKNGKECISCSYCRIDCSGLLEEGKEDLYFIKKGENE